MLFVVDGWVLAITPDMASLVGRKSDCTLACNGWGVERTIPPRRQYAVARDGKALRGSP